MILNGYFYGGDTHAIIGTMEEMGVGGLEL